MSGSLKSDATVANLTRETSERLGKPFLLQAGPDARARRKAGDLGACGGAQETRWMIRTTLRHPDSDRLGGTVMRRRTRLVPLTWIT